MERLFEQYNETQPETEQQADVLPTEDTDNHHEMKKQKTCENIHTEHVFSKNKNKIKTSKLSEGTHHAYINRGCSVLVKA